MAPARPVNLPNARRLGWAIAIAIVLLDQLSKGWVLEAFQIGERLNVLPVFDLVRVHNYGAAFSFLASGDGSQRWFLLVVALVASVLIHRWMAGANRLTLIALALILGGAIGNAIDRALLGSVTDFLLFYYQRWYFPAFNLADCAITLGAVGMILDSILEWRRERITHRT